MNFQFEPTITLGTIITVISFLGGIIGVSMKFGGRLSIIESRVGDLWKDFIDRKHNNSWDGIERRKHRWGD